MKEKHEKDVDELAEAGANEINELEGKLEQVNEKLYEVTSRQEQEVNKLKQDYESQISELRAQIKAMQEQLRKDSEARLEVSAKEDGTTVVLMKF